MIMIPFIETVLVFAVCKTDGCVNCNIAIEIEAVKDSASVLCGGCSVLCEVVEKN